MYNQFQSYPVIHSSYRTFVKSQRQRPQISQFKCECDVGIVFNLIDNKKKKYLSKHVIR